MRVLIALTCSCLIVAASAAGQKGGEWKIQLYGGKSDSRNSFIHLEQPGKNTSITFNGVNYDDNSFQQPIYYGARVLYFPNSIPWLGFGVDFFHFKVYSDPDGTVRAVGTEKGVPINRTQRLGDSIQRFDISHGVNYLCFTVLARTEWVNGRLIPYVGIGMGPTILHPESTIDGESYQKYEWDVPSWQGLIGAEYFFQRNASVFFEYKYTNQSFNVKVAGGTARTRVSTDHWVFGVSWRI